MTTLLPHQQRVVDEKAELDEKLERLIAFIGSGKYLDLSDSEMVRLLRQSNYMTDYSKVLGERIAAFEV